MAFIAATRATRSGADRLATFFRTGIAIPPELRYFAASTELRRVVDDRLGKLIQ
jgi:hypothetical protein